MTTSLPSAGLLQYLKVAYKPLFRGSYKNILLSDKKCSLFKCVFFVNIRFITNKPFQFMLLFYLAINCCTYSNPPSLLFH